MVLTKRRTIDLGYIVIIGLLLAVGLYNRYRIRQKVFNLIDLMHELGMEIEIATRSGDFSSLEEIIEKSEEIRKSYPFIARFGDFKPLRAEFLNHYNQLLTQIDSVHRELEVRRRVDEIS